MGLDKLKSIELKEDLGRTNMGNSAISKHGKKPLMERYRRQKINNYLEELKCLVLSALNKEVSSYNKMEKADILHMAVKYVRAVQTTTTTTSETIPRNYRQQREYTTKPKVSGYQVRSLSPLRVSQSVNTNYDNLCQSSRGTRRDEMKENCMASNGREIFSSILPKATRTLNSTHCCSQEHSPVKEYTITKPLTCETMKKCVQTQTNAEIDSKIWRPW